MSLESNTWKEHKYAISDYFTAKDNIYRGTGLEGIINRNTLADVGLGLLLSGGIDSSLIASRISDKNISTYTVGFDSNKFDETSDANAIASHLGLSNTSVMMKGELNIDFTSLVRAFDQPIADPSIMNELYKNINKSGLKVVLGGDGGDELFNGYKYMTVFVNVIYKFSHST